MIPFLSHVKILYVLTLCVSSTGKHNCSEFISIPFLSCTEDTDFLWSSLMSGSYHLFVPNSTMVTESSRRDIIQMIHS